MTQWPDSFELDSFFESVAKIAVPQDGFWEYQYSQKQITIKFSINKFESSIQTTLLYDDQKISVTSHEGVKSLIIRKERGEESLIGEFEMGIHLKLILRPNIRLRWYSLMAE